MKSTCPDYGEYDYRRYDVTELSDYANRDRVTNPANWGIIKRAIHEADSFTEHLTAKHAADLMSKGCDKSTKRVDQIIDELHSDPNTTQKFRRVRRRRVWSDEGDDICAERLLAAETDTMWHSYRRDARGLAPVVTLVVGWCVSAATSYEQMCFRGALAVAVYDELIKRGFDIDLIVASNSDVHNHHRAVLIDVAKSGERIDKNRLAAMLCRVGVFRTLGFCTYAWSPFTQPPGLGYPVAMTSKNLEKTPIEKPYHVLPDVFDMDQLREAYQSSLNEICGEFIR